MPSANFRNPRDMKVRIETRNRVEMDSVKTPQGDRRRAGSSAEVARAIGIISLDSLHQSHPIPTPPTNATNALTIVTKFVAIHLPARKFSCHTSHIWGPFRSICQIPAQAAVHGFAVGTEISDRCRDERTAAHECECHNPGLNPTGVLDHDFQFRTLRLSRPAWQLQELNQPPRMWDAWS